MIPRDCPVCEGFGSLPVWGGKEDALGEELACPECGGDGVVDDDESEFGDD